MNSCAWEGVGVTRYFRGKEAIELGLKEHVVLSRAGEMKRTLERKHGLGRLAPVWRTERKIKPRKVRSEL